jgi:RNA polymerase subunit RPABC4/transcription elongation factor Spt4
MADWGSILTLAALVALAYAAAVWIALVFWTLRDVRRRTTDETQQAGAVLLVALASVPGWLVYLLIRPSQTFDDVRIDDLQTTLFARELTAEPSCSRCHRMIEADFMVCPYCRESLRTPCGNCARAVATHWAACAYCGEPQQRPAFEPARAASAAAPQPAPARARPRTAAQPLVAPEAR